MAHTGKSGLDYFPFDVDFFNDEKIEFLSARFGLKGEAITIRLLSKIYRNGYYLQWGEDEALLFAKRVGDGCQHSFVTDVVYELVKRGFLDESIFNRFAVLTSKGIQKRYFEASERRKKIELIKEYCLIDVSKMDNVNIIKKNVNILPENVIKNPQRKGKKSKVKKSKERKISEISMTEISTPCEKITFHFWELFKTIMQDEGITTTVLDNAIMDKWEQQTRLMIERKECTLDQLREIYKWLNERCTKSSKFWASNIRSIVKLREKLPTILMQMRSEEGINMKKIASW